MHKLRRTSFELGLIGAYFPVKKIYNLEINFAPQQKTLVFCNVLWLPLKNIKLRHVKAERGLV